MSGWPQGGRNTPEQFFLGFSNSGLSSGTGFKFLAPLLEAPEFFENRLR